MSTLEIDISLTEFAQPLTCVPKQGHPALGASLTELIVEHIRDCVWFYYRNYPMLRNDITKGVNVCTVRIFCFFAASGIHTAEITAGNCVQNNNHDLLISECVIQFGPKVSDGGNIGHPNGLRRGSDALETSWFCFGSRKALRRCRLRIDKEFAERMLSIEH